MVCMFVEEHGQPMCRAVYGWSLTNEYLDGRRRYTRPIWAREPFLNDFNQVKERWVVVDHEEAYTDWSYVDCPRCHAWRRDPEGMRRQEQEAAAQAEADRAAAQAAVQAHDRGCWEKVIIFLSIASAIGFFIGLLIADAESLSGRETFAAILAGGAVPILVLAIPIIILLFTMGGGGSPYRKIVLAALVLAALVLALAAFIGS